MLDINKKIEMITNYLGEVIDIGDISIDNIKSAISLLKEIPPVDAPNTFNREQRLISVSDDISWIIMSLNRKKQILEEKMKSIRAPEYTRLVRQGRPSTEAINMELYMLHDDMNELSRKINVLDNFIIYLNSIQENINRYIWMLRERLNFLK